MTDRKHTAGPGWEFDGVRFVDITKPHGNTQLHARGTDLANFYEAAPDMYEALKEAASVLAMMTDPQSITGSSIRNAWAQAVSVGAKARAALSKAEGSAALSPETKE